MGGSGGGGRLTYREEQALEQVARKKLQEGAQPERRNVFISFVKEDENEVNLLRGQAQKEDSNLDFRDYSLKEPFDSKNAEYIRRGIRERIKQCSVTLVYVTDDASHSKWIDWEIRESIKLEKGIIAVYKGETPPAHLPPAIREFNVKLVPWKQKEITEAINQAAKKRS